MTTPDVLLLLAGLTAASGVTLLLLGIRALVRNARVRRVQVPATLLRSSWVGPGEVVDVEYPAPDGSTLGARLYVNFVDAPGLPSRFDGTVWVDPDDPRDVTPRRVGRNAWGTVGTVTGSVLLVAGGVLAIVRAATSG